jgi:DNA polymerase-3 subunit gamma/tau
MGLALYRKYRPSDFTQVSGQEHIKITLKNELAQNKISHAYLFSGPRGTGKTTLARILAKAVNCENRKPGDSEPCNQCPSCKSINENSALDVIEIDAASNRGVENVQSNIINYVRIRPSSSKYKVFIIDEVHMLTSYAFNALLKTLEEPPEYAIFILATTEAQKILPTIISRCQRFDFKKIEAIAMKKRLLNLASTEGVQVEDQVLDLLVHYSEGCMRDAESLLSQLLSLDEKIIGLDQAHLILPRSHWAESYKLLSLLFSKKLSDALLMVNELLADGLDLDAFLKDFVMLLRQLLLVKLGVGQIVALDAKRLADIDKLLEFVSVPHLLKIINSFIAVGQQGKSSFIPQLPLEMALISAMAEDDLVNNQTLKVAPVISKPIDEPKKVETKETVEKSAPVNEIINVTDNVIVTEQVSVKSEETVSESAILMNDENQESSVPDNKECPVNVEALRSRWYEVKNLLKKENISLASLMSVAGLKQENGKLLVIFKHQFNYDQVYNSHELQDLVSKAIETVVGHACQVAFAVDPNIVSCDSRQCVESNNTGQEDSQDNNFLEILGVERAF